MLEHSLHCLQLLHVHLLDQLWLFPAHHDKHPLTTELVVGACIAVVVDAEVVAASVSSVHLDL